MPPLKYWKIKQHLEKVAIHPESATRMPTVRELMSDFNVSLATVNRALTELENEGVIIRRQGVGIIAAGNNRTVTRIRNTSPDIRRNILWVYNDYPDEGIWNMGHAIGQYSRQAKCNMIDCKVYPDTTTEELMEFILKQPDCIGIILQFSSDRMDSERLAAFGKLPFPVVLADSMFFYSAAMPENMYAISPDAADGARKTAELLLRKGHRKIGYIRNEPHTEYADLFQKTLVSAFTQAGLDFNSGHIFSAQIRSWDNSLDAAIQLTQNNLDNIRRLGLTALIYKSTGGALAALRPLMQAGIRIPEDISIISEGERSLYRYLPLQLSTTTTNYEKIGCLAVDLIVGKYKPKKRNIFLPQHVIERESVRDLNHEPSRKHHV